MSKVSEKGPRKLNKDAYSDLQYEQAQAHMQNLGKVQSSSVPGANWRDPKSSEGGEEKLSKHAKRRAKKKEKQQNQEQ